MMIRMMMMMIRMMMVMIRMMMMMMMLMMMITVSPVMVGGTKSAPVTPDRLKALAVQLMVQ